VPAAAAPADRSRPQPACCRAQHKTPCAPVR
jgi:hypothetical protein